MSATSETMTVAPAEDPAPAGDAAKVVQLERPIGGEGPARPPQPNASAQQKPDFATRSERTFLYVALSLVLLALIAGMIVFGSAAQSDYREGIDVSHDSLAGKIDPSVGLMFTLQLARARDAVVLKLAALGLGYLIVVLGCMFVLKGVEASYKIKVHGGKGDSALQTSSPGLVLITFGAILVATTVLVQSRITTNVAPDGVSGSDDASDSAGVPTSTEFSKHANLPVP